MHPLLPFPSYRLLPFSLSSLEIYITLASAHPLLLNLLRDTYIFLASLAYLPCVLCVPYFASLPCVPYLPASLAYPTLRTPPLLQL
ncbi:hypothetical protein C8F01DRAFT_1139277, partial [Mycena amicta]